MPMYIDIHTHSSQVSPGNTLQIHSLYGNYDVAVQGEVCSMGIHPWYVQDSERKLRELRQFAVLNNVLAIGECGLDKVCDTDWDIQVTIFREQVLLAQQLSKPLVIHCVKAYTEVMQVLDNSGVTIPVIFHGFNRNEHIAASLLAKGYYLSFGARTKENITIARVLRQVPAERFFCETDDSEITIAAIYEEVAAIRETPLNDIILQVEKNFNNVFKRTEK